MLRPEKIHTRNLITKKNSCGSKIPYSPHNFSNGPPLTLIGLISMQDQSKPLMFEGGIEFLKLRGFFKPSPALKTFALSLVL